MSIRLADCFGEIEAALSTSLGNTDRFVIKHGNRRIRCIEFAISRVGFTDEALAGLEDIHYLGRKVAKDALI